MRSDRPSLLACGAAADEDVHNVQNVDSALIASRSVRLAGRRRLAKHPRASLRVLGQRNMSPAKIEISGSYAPWRDDWLGSYTEEVLEPHLPIVDAHHHLWDRVGSVYLFEQMLADIATGHNIIATIYCECRSMYRGSGPDAFRPVGEVEFVNGVAAMSASGGYGSVRVCSGIVGSLDLRLPEASAVLDALIGAGNGRLKGVRQVSSWDADPNVVNRMAHRPPQLLGNPDFRRGFAHLASRGLSFDAYLFHPQIPELISLARDFPETQIILDHVSTPIGVASYAGKREAVFHQWSSSVRELAKCPNVWVKIGGLGMKILGFDFHNRPVPASSVQLADAWRPYLETCIEAFGAERSMFESNFPPDKGSCSYRTLWNAFKRITSGCSAEVKSQLFSQAAIRCYRLALPDPGFHDVVSNEPRNTSITAVFPAR